MASLSALPGHSPAVVVFWQEQAEKLLGSGYCLVVPMSPGSASKGVGEPKKVARQKRGYPPTPPPQT